VQIYKGGFPAHIRQHLTFEKFTLFQQTGNVLWEKFKLNSFKSDYEFN